MSNDFAVFILTHGRPNNIKTLRSLKNAGYTGKIYIVVDDEDDTLEEYRDNYASNLLVFNKKEIAKTFDTGDNFKNNKTIVYARNACFVLAKKLGVDYFMQLDDDYTQFDYRFNNRLEYCHKPIRNLDKVFSIMLEFYKKTNGLLTVAMAQGGDFIGGKNSGWSEELKLRRKAMNTFICSTKRNFKFVGRINEDVNTYVNLGGKGKLLLTLPNISITQTNTQKSKGGMTDVYLDNGTYLKSFYSVMYNPSCVKITEMGDKYKRLHHKVKWNNAVPKILNENIRK